ncbi:small acid-soluble spore protein K [Tuberibacillus calidus]|uniref:small acid-soluble spore protein K n=1 Tax=Tuberibacillus calidus TaxID=340097 RepID=UPI0003F4B9C9|nr:small acid-soluble spore protein K [Tuberibacillus calidus]
MVDREEKAYSVQNENSIQPRAKSEFSPKSPNGRLRTQPMSRMVQSNQSRHQND